MKTCLITGASKGIGRAIAIELSNQEDVGTLLLLSRDQKKLEETKELMNPNKQIEVFPIDLSNLEEAENSIRQIGSDFKQIDLLINNAGYVDPQSLLETTIENWENTFRTNVTATFIVTREVVKYMKKTGGKILNISSTAGMSSRPGWLAYAASKAAVISMSNTLSDELQEYGIKVYCISPGRCATDLRRVLAPDEDPSTIMQPQDVARAVSNLLSPAGDYLDGQNMVIRKQI